MKLGLYQGPGASGRREENHAIMARVTRECADLGCGLVIFPELFASGYNIGDRMFDAAEPADGPTSDALSAAARTAGIAILAGYPELAGKAIHNSAMLMGPDGTPLANARKTHLFGAEEQRLFTPGEELTLARVGDLPIGVLICYDVEFPEAARTLALRGAELIAVPTALMQPYGWIAEHVLPARAWENQVFVAYANRCGREDDLDYCGASCVIAPDGSELARAGPGEELLVAEIDPAAFERSRLANPYLADRRPELYRTPVDGQFSEGGDS